MNKHTLGVDPHGNQIIYELLSDHETSLTTAPLQLFSASKIPPRSWNLVTTGIGCFVEDEKRKAYYIQV